MASLRKGMVFIHNQTHEKITYGKKTDDGQCWCITAKNDFIIIPEETLKNDYTSLSDRNKSDKERRSRQAW